MISFSPPRFSLSRLCAALLLGWALAYASTVSADTQVYSFEPDLQGFHANGGGVTVDLQTGGLGATSGTNSMKLDFADTSTFAGGLTESIHSAFNDPLGLDFVRFDLTNTNRFVPPNPVIGQTPTFANMSVTFFGTFPSDPEAQIQFQLTEEAVGTLEPGSHEVEIDISNTGGPLHSGGGLYLAGGEFKGYDAWVDLGFVPLGFQIYLNKNGKAADPTFAWTIYIDNIRVGRFVTPVPGDYNGNGTVDAADYVVWRKNNGTTSGATAAQGDGDGDGDVDDADRLYWRARFGNTSGSGSGLGGGSVPEPTSIMLLLLASAAYGIGARKRS